MNVTDLLAQAGGLRSIARELGVTEAQASSGAAALVPAILGGFKKRAQTQPGGAAGLGGLLQQLGGADLLDNVVSAQPTDVSRGNDVLGAIFGSKEVSRAVAQRASTQSGLGPDVLRKMLPMLAMAVSGMMAKGAPVGAPPAPPAGGLGSMLGGMLGGQAGNALSALAGGSAAGGAAAGAGGLGGLLSMLDADGDGNPLDDIMKMVGKARG